MLCVGFLAAFLEPDENVLRGTQDSKLHAHRLFGGEDSESPDERGEKDQLLNHGELLANALSLSCHQWNKKMNI